MSGRALDIPLYIRQRIEEVNKLKWHSRRKERYGLDEDQARYVHPIVMPKAFKKKVFPFFWRTEYHPRTQSLWVTVYGGLETTHTFEISGIVPQESEDGAT